MTAQSKKGKNTPYSHHCTGIFFFFFGIGFKNNNKKNSQFKVHLLSSYVSFLLLKGLALYVHNYFSQATSKEPLPEFPCWYYSGPGTVTFFHRPSILCYNHDFLNAIFTVPKHFSCTFTASYQHTVIFPGTCSASPGKGYENTARELCWCITHSHCT